jgi:predicted nucleotidyltransferase
MVTASATDLLRTHAHVIARHLAEAPAVEGVCLFGSVARGDAVETSDIDLLVVGADTELTPSKLLRTIPEQLRNLRLSLLYYSGDDLEALFASGASFVDHLRHEGEILYDERGTLSHVLEDEFSPSLNVADELESELARLEVYEDLAMFKDNFLFVLAQLYAIGKSIVMLGLVSEGASEYNREAAFAAFERRHADHADDLRRVARLRPFYALVTRRRSEALPFPYRGADGEAREAIEAIRRLAAIIR